MQEFSGQAQARRRGTQLRAMVVLRCLARRLSLHREPIPSRTGITVTTMSRIAIVDLGAAARRIHIPAYRRVPALPVGALVAGSAQDGAPAGVAACRGARHAL